MNKIKLEAAIFDFDGTLVDSETLYTKSLIATANKMNVLQDVDFESMAGYQTQDMYNILIKSHYVPDNFFDETADYFHKIIETDLETFDGVMETLERLKNINIVIASNSDIDYVKNISDKKGFSKYIKDYSCHNEKLKAKPEPDLFLNAFETLKKLNKNLKKENVLIFEDSLAGVEGAKKTGIKIAAITNSYNKEELLKKGADIILNKIDEIFDYIEI
ncbi:HAD family hydrolase [Brachyspira catarrhinii]|uniref:HAD family phosphatase n=1 Tax=Brachyspira catarrhinii TaxID=2528966 RepID=A0ABY2TSZ1_9SPIR|nr:HAD family phosphatase [Brachyspira catarrhinii]TKZ35306.1 HAD family phosphatase [Brachyspira catarrhinii]